MNPIISVIIPAWNEGKYIGKTLRSLRRQTLPRDEYEIIVVDGNSTDRTREIARNLGARVLIESKKSIGYARNLGARHAKGEIVAFIDADTIAPENWLRTIKNALMRRGLLGVGGPVIPTGGSRKVRSYFRLSRRVSEASAKLGFFGFLGSNCAYRKREFLASRGFRPRIKYMEDIEFSLRFSKNRRKRCRFLKGMKVHTSSRRLQQSGVLSHALQTSLGFFCLITKTKFPKDYSRALAKAGAEGTA